MNILFVYNAKNDVVNSTIGYLHKVFKPSTYPCQLCEITYHNFGKRSDWKDYLGQTEHNFEFTYINEFEEKFKERPTYPIVYEVKNGKLNILLNKEEIEACNSLDDFIEFFEQLTTN